ncbi:ecotropic viral integration site 5 ortholog-like isoform X2 [Tachypleus tridentatus]|uniref:ecotropic viral integration site 5 ortholog-like isoform X2 n=1 Tax=Tachypleus tridentatus TaxID=6853 RepID=UPI003FCF6822
MSTFSTELEDERLQCEDFGSNFSLLQINHDTNDRISPVSRFIHPRRVNLPPLSWDWSRLKRILESNSKSLNSLTHTHSQKSMDSSLVSVHSSHSIAPEDEQLEEDVWIIWGKIVNDWDNHMKKRHLYVKEQVRKGIPHHFRGLAWQLLCNAQNCSAKEHFAEYIKISSPCEKVIRRDIARTYPEHEFFRDKDGPGQEGLFNVMKAYSLHDREVGYCQGSAFIVGLLLLQMPEEEAFAVLTRLMEDYRLREIYKPSMAELGLCMYQLESIVQELLPELHVHFQSQSFYTSMYASSWFLTLFTATLPLQLASRVMDLFLSEYFQKEMPSKCETDPDYLVTMALQVKYNSKKMKKLEKDYTTLKVKEHDELIEMKRLRTENRLLKQRIENLEQESSSLADRLIRGQVTRAQELEDNFAIKQELADLRDKEQMVKQELDLAYQQVQALSEAGSQPPSIEKSGDNLIQSLQEELVVVKLREAEKDDIMQDLRGQIQELEDANKQLQETKPDKTLAQLQEELVSVKLREAEANLSMKELRQTVSDLQTIWLQHLNESKAGSPELSKKWDKTLVVELQEELISARIREADAVAELKELHQKVIELEAQNQVILNQIRHQEEEVETLHKTMEETIKRERALQNQLKEEQRKFASLDSKIKEEQMLDKIKEEKLTQVIAELRQNLSSLEIRSQEMMAAGQLRHRLGHVSSKDSKDLHEQVSEIVHLGSLNKKLTSADAIQNPSSPIYSLSKDNSLTNLLELTMSQNNSFCDESLGELLHVGDDQSQLSNEHLLNKNNKTNGEADS